jgi:cyclic pyranopterin monophosphate synthase
MGGMIDVTEKPVVRRFAAASGRIDLSKGTLQEIREGRIRKGHPFPVAEVAAMNAAKQTHLLIPHCHQIALDSVSVAFELLDDRVNAVCSVRAQARTGVEMEAIVGVTAALYTIWDMVKYLEKDVQGQYPSTGITDIRVIKKEKGVPTEETKRSA